MGRKTKYLREYKQKLEEHMEKGNSYTSFAASIGVHIDTLYEWEKKFPEFSEAKKTAFTHSQAFWEDLGLKMAINGNAQVWKFNMKNRFGWVESPPTNTEGTKEIRLAYSNSNSSPIDIHLDLQDFDL